MSLTEEDISTLVRRVMAEIQPPAEVEQQAVNLGMFQVASGQTILADHMNSALQIGVPKFANTAARDAQWPSPPVGAMCYLQDVNYFQTYDNLITGGANAWHPVGGLRMGYATMGGAGGTQSIPNNTETLVALGTAGGAANKAGRATWNANGSVTLPLTGTYLVTGGVCWPSNANGERRCYIQKYAAGAWGFGGCAGGVQETNVAGTSYLRQQVTSQVYAAAGEQVGMRVFQGSGSALSLIAGADVARLGVHLLGAD